MSDAEFQDLQNFGKTIEIKQENNSKKKVKGKPSLKKEFKIHFDWNKRKKIFVSFSKSILKNGRMINEKVNDAVNEFYNWSEKRKFKRLKTSLKNNEPRTCYRLVETRKQRGNKTIIIRERIPVKPKENGGSDSFPRNLFDLTFSFDDNSQVKSCSKSDDGPRVSIWDVPVDVK